MKTYSTKAGDIQHQWLMIDASGVILGKLATKVAGLLMGKHKSIFTPNMDTGDYVVIINAANIKVTGKKNARKNILSTFYVPRRFEGSILGENAADSS